jgi:hypothetical protein
MLVQTDLENKFTYHPPKDDQIASYTTIRKFAKEYAMLINELVPDSREKSLAITRIEESVMWANAGIARKDDGVNL